MLAGVEHKVYEALTPLNQMTIKVLCDRGRVSEWLSVARLAGLRDETATGKAIQQSFNSRTPRIGIPLYLEDNDKIIATAFLRHVYGDNPGAIHLFHIAVRQGFRGRGIGARLIDEVCRFVKKLGFTFVLLSTVSAGRFYTSCGFRQYGLIPGIATRNRAREYYYRDLRSTKDKG